MTILYKLTDEFDRTYGDCWWGKNVTHEADGEGEGELCTRHWIHAYRDPLLAVLMNPVHGHYQPESMHLWECEGDVGKDDGTKVGCTRLTAIRRMDVPQVTTGQRVKFGILCALEVYREPGFVAWAEGWLSGKDGTQENAREMLRIINAAHDVVCNKWVQYGDSLTYKTYEEVTSAYYAKQAEVDSFYGIENDAASAACHAQMSRGGELDLVALARKAILEEP